MKWIEMTGGAKTMPPAGKSVLLLQKTGYNDNTVVIVGRWIDRFTERSDEDYAEYCEEKDDYFLPAGFYENQFNWGEYAAIFINEEVTHWMEQPEKPK